MNERTLKCIVERGDTDALETYIQRGCSPFSQPLDAQVRFAYHHLPCESGRENGAHPFVATEREASLALREDYCGPTTTVIVRPQRKKASVAGGLPSRLSCAASPYRRGSHSQSKLAEIAWVMNGSKWTTDILRRSSPLYSLRDSRDLFFPLRSTVAKSPSNPSTMVEVEQLPAAAAPLESAVRSVISSRDGGALSLSEHNAERFRRVLHSLETEERRERLKIETALEELLIRDRSSFNLLVDRCAREQHDLFVGEFIARSKLREEEHTQFKEIVGLCLDDVTGCRWDGVRMQWVRTLMANALVMHEWLVLNSLFSQKHRASHDDGGSKDAAASPRASAVWANEGSESGRDVRCSDALVQSTNNRKELPMSHGDHDDDSPVELRRAAGSHRPHHQLSARPSRPRVLPPLSPHEECLMC